MIYDEEDIEFETDDRDIIEFINDRIAYCEKCMKLRDYDSKDYWYWNGRREELLILRDELKGYIFTKK